MACSGLGTPPPNEPECRSTAGPRRVISTPVRPRIDTTALGRSRAAMPVSLTTTTSQARRSLRSWSRAAKCGEPGLLLALDQQLDRDGGGVAAGRGEVGADAEQVEGDVALVVDGAAGVQLGAVRALDDRGLERRVHPELRRVDRLHVVVAVDQRDGCVGVGAGPLGVHRGRAGGRPDLDGREADAGQRPGQPGGAVRDVVGVRGVGGDRRDAQPGVEVGVQVVEVGTDEVALWAGLAAAHGHRR